MITRVLKLLANPYFAAYTMARKFVVRYEGFNYSFKKNGEERLLNALAYENVKTIFDVGSNIGNWTEIAARKFPNADIHSFEISETTFKSLQEKHADKKVSLNNFGLSNEEGQFEYKDYGKNSGVNTLLLDSDFHDDCASSVLVKTFCQTGDNYCDSNKIEEIDILKIDVEGAEHLVLNGFNRLLESGAIKVIQFEYGYANGDARFLMKDFYRLLESYGYVLGPLKASGVLFMTFDYALNDFKSGPNYVAVHKSFNNIIERVKGKEIKGFPRR